MTTQHEKATRYVVCRNFDQGPGESTIVWLARGSIVVVVDDLATAERFSDQLREDGSTIEKSQQKGKDNEPGST